MVIRTQRELVYAAAFFKLGSTGKAGAKERLAALAIATAIQAYGFEGLNNELLSAAVELQPKKEDKAKPPEVKKPVKLDFLEEIHGNDHANTEGRGS